MNFKPSENEEKYFAQLEIERRRKAEQRRGRPSGNDAGTGRHATEPAATEPTTGSEG